MQIVNLFARNKSIIKNNAQSLIGKSKKEVNDWLEDDYISFEEAVWKYTLKRNWYGIDKILIISFEGEVSKNLRIKKAFRILNF